MFYMKKCIYLMLIIVSVALVSGCIDVEKQPSSIDLLERIIPSSVGDTNLRLVFYDDELNSIKNTGTISIRILNSEGIEVYSKEYDVVKKDFKPYKQPFTGELMWKYDVVILKSEIKNSIVDCSKFVSEWEGTAGTIYITFTTVKGTELTIDTMARVPIQECDYGSSLDTDYENTCRAIENHPNLDYECRCILLTDNVDESDDVKEKSAPLCRCTCDIGNGTLWTTDIRVAV